MLTKTEDRIITALANQSAKGRQGASKLCLTHLYLLLEAENPTRSTAELSKALNVDTNSINHLTTSLQSGWGYLQRDLVKTRTGREVRLRITEAGRAALNEYRQAIRQAMQKPLAETENSRRG